MLLFLPTFITLAYTQLGTNTILKSKHCTLSSHKNRVENECVWLDGRNKK